MVPSQSYEPPGDKLSGGGATGDGPVISYGSGLPYPGNYWNRLAKQLLEQMGTANMER